MANTVRATISGGGNIEVTNQEKLRLSNVTLGCSVNVNANGKLYFGYINYGADTTSRFRINGGTAEADQPNSNFISNQSAGTYHQPIEVAAGGNLNFVASTTVVSYIDCSGIVLVQGTQANPTVILTITGDVPGPSEAALRVQPSGILNLAAASTISGQVSVHGGMNLFGAPPGSTATVCTIAQGNFYVWGTPDAHARLNLNTGTLNISNGTMVLNYAAVSTFVAYGDNPNDEVRMGNITASGAVTFQNINTLTQGATGTPKAFSLPLITASLGINGDFSVYVLSDPTIIHRKVGDSILLERP